MSASGFSCTPVAPISVICVVLIEEHFKFYWLRSLIRYDTNDKMYSESRKNRMGTPRKGKTLTPGTVKTGRVGLQMRTQQNRHSGHVEQRQATPRCKPKRQYLLTLQVSRYCLCRFEGHRRAPDHTKQSWRYQAPRSDVVVGDSQVISTITSRPQPYEGVISYFTGNPRKHGDAGAMPFECLAARPSTQQASFQLLAFAGIWPRLGLHHCCRLLAGSCSLPARLSKGSESISPTWLQPQTITWPYLAEISPARTLWHRAEVACPWACHLLISATTNRWQSHGIFHCFRFKRFVHISEWKQIAVSMCHVLTHVYNCSVINLLYI